MIYIRPFQINLLGFPFLLTPLRRPDLSPAQEGMTKMGLGKSSQSLGQWNDVDHDILVRIFQRNPQPHLLRMVCRSWRCACFNALFWKFNFLDMSTPFFIDESSDFSILDHDMEIKLMNTIKGIFKGDHAHRIPPDLESVYLFDTFPERFSYFR